jgi:hypothetical protein
MMIKLYKDTAARELDFFDRYGQLAKTPANKASLKANSIMHD